MSDLYNDQEQVDMIKNWWRKNGTTLLTIIVIAAAIILGYQWWQKRENAQQANASIAYQSLLSSVNANNATDITAKAQSLVKESPKSSYAGLSVLIQAASDARTGDLAGAQKQYQWIIKNQKNANIVDLAKLQLARIQLANGKASDAIKTLTPVSKIYSAADQVVLGDAYTAQKDVAKARTAYQAAIKALPKSDPMTSFVTLKLNNLPEVAP